jgi:hypothetical protein
MSTAVETEIRPFHVEITSEQIDDLRRRIAGRSWSTTARRASSSRR